MNRLRILLLALAVGLCLCLQTASAQAHVLLTDKSGKNGAILHMSPDDDPIASESNTIFFDIQGEDFSQYTHNVVLRITDDQNHTVYPAATFMGSSVSTLYAFPRQGVYRIALIVEPHAGSGAITFEHSQRVARGVAGSVLDQPTHAWGDIGMVIGLCGLLLLGIIGINRRDIIAKYSE